MPICSASRGPIPLWALGLLAFSAASSIGCGASAEPVAPQADDRVVRAAGYEVHEWGLMRALPGDVLSAGAIAPPREAIALTVDKPVLYFYADAATRLERVGVEVVAGDLAEYWPEPSTADATHLAWNDVSLSLDGACDPTPLPSPNDPRCTGLPPGELCEVPSLAVVRAPSAACVRVGSSVERFLFYRARARTFTPPLRFERSAGGVDVSVTNEGSAPIPGFLVRLQDHYGSVRALAVRPPAPGQTLVVGADFTAVANPSDESVGDMPALPGSPEPGRRAVRESLTELGLTAEECDAFLRAWDYRLFGVNEVVTDVDRLSDRRGRDGDETDIPQSMSESFLYFIPEAQVDEVARLSFDPPPRAVRRAMAVWSPIPASGASH